MGESNCAWSRPLFLRREALTAAAAIYKNMYGSADSVPATFQLLYFIGWKPHPLQVRPMMVDEFNRFAMPYIMVYL